MTKKTVGLCIYGDFDPAEGRFILSYGLEPRARKRGFAREALRSVISELFSRPNVCLLIADVELRNKDSINLLLRLKFLKDGEVHVTVADGRPAERYKLAREHWLASCG